MFFSYRVIPWWADGARSEHDLTQSGVRFSPLVPQSASTFACTLVAGERPHDASGRQGEVHRLGPCSSRHLRGEDSLMMGVSKNESDDAFALSYGVNVSCCWVVPGQTVYFLVPPSHSSVS